MNHTDWPLHQVPEFAELWARVEPYTMTSPQRGYALWQAVNHVLDAGITGALVECGVWKGGSAMLMALALQARGENRDLYLFDTFDGMTVPDSVDRDLAGRTARECLDGQYGEELEEQVRACAPLESVRQVMESTGYDSRFIHYVQGDVEQTLPCTQTLGVALLRLDTDFYRSTIAELRHLYPRMGRGGVVIIDDYGHWQGAQKAVDDYFAADSNARNKPMLWAVDYTGRGFVKPDESAQLEIERYDYVPPGMADPGLLRLFHFAEPADPWLVKWDYMRPSVPHTFRCDVRNEKKVQIGNASYEEAVCLHNIARQFSGKRGLEIGSHFGWTGAHLLAAGLSMDFIDPEISNPERVAALNEVFGAISSAATYRLWPLYSPEAISAVMAASSDPFSFVFIDGNHAGDAPEKDARGILHYCADDAIVMFHDLTSPDVARGLGVFQQAGWNTGLFNTMQVLGLAWRGDVSIPPHVRDRNAPDLTYAHLKDFPVL